MAQVSGIFAERHLHFRTREEDREVIVQFGPVVKEDNAASCRYTIIGLDEPISFEILGFDEVQAVQLAMTMAGSELNRRALDGEYGITFDLSGDTGHGLPSFDLRQTAP
jgi:hypothetical protein